MKNRSNRRQMKARSEKYEGAPRHRPSTAKGAEKSVGRHPRGQVQRSYRKTYLRNLGSARLEGRQNRYQGVGWNERGSAPTLSVLQEKKNVRVKVVPCPEFIDGREPSLAQIPRDGEWCRRLRAMRVLETDDEAVNDGRISRLSRRGGNLQFP